jgi:hypothetical protein
MRAVSCIGFCVSSCVLGIFGGLVISSMHSPKSRRVILPHASFSHDQKLGYIEARGTWERDDKEDALPNQTTTIECWRSESTCTEVTAALADTGFMPLDINHLKIISWNEQVAVVCAARALTTAERYVIDLKSRSVSGGVGPRREGSPCPTEIEATFKMIDGYYRSLPALKKALEK